MGDMLGGALEDILEGLRLSPVWLKLGWEQTVSRFRRTILGPFWLSVNLLVVAFALSFLFGGLTGTGSRAVFVSMITGLLAWSLIGGPIGESANVFIGSGGVMQSQKLPLSFHIYLLTYRAFINFVAQVLSVWAVFLLFRVGTIPAWPIVFTLPLVLANVFLISLILAVPATRFRDVNQLVGFVIQIAFFITPVFWSPQQMNPKYRFLLEYNPLAHLLELIRQPMLGRLPAAVHYGWAIMSIFVLGGVAVSLLALYRKRVVFWL